MKPVDPAHVNATLPFLTPHLRCMVELQRLTGMRPGEVCQLRFCEVDRDGDIWVYRPTQHKTAHHGKTRSVHIGPRAQAVVTAFLVGDSPPPEGFARIDPADDTARVVMADAYQEAGRSLYSQTTTDAGTAETPPPSGEPAGAGAGTPPGDGKPEDVVEADYEIVDDNKK